MPLPILIGFLMTLLLGAGWWLGRRHLRRKAARTAYEEAPVPKSWEAVLRRRVSCYRLLPEPVRRRLHRQAKVFLAEKTFTACGGLRAVDDAMAVTIAGQACLLLAGRDGTACFPSVSSVLVYPDFFYSRVRTFHPDSGAEFVHTEARVGEACPLGSVVLSWREILQANALAGNGQNLVLHEFAHHIRPAGAALLAELDAGWRRLRADGSDAVLDSYGAESPDEFWAVSVEAFFESAERLREAHPAWYVHLKEFFGLDPAAWGS